MDICGQLPVEISQKILEFLSPEDLLACSRVCRGWRKLADYELLWRRHCASKGWHDTSYVDNNRTHYPKNIIQVEGEDGQLWPLNRWALTFQFRSEIPLSWERGQSIDYRLSPRDEQVTVLSCDGQLLAIGYANGAVSILDVQRVPHLVANLSGLLEGYRIHALAISGGRLVLVQSMLLQIYTASEGGYVLVDAKSFEMGFTYIEALQRYSDKLDNFVLWYTSVIKSDRYTNEWIAATVHFEISGDLIYVGVRDYQMIYVWSLTSGKREDTIHIPSNTCKLRDLLFYQEKLYVIYASRNVRHITVYDIQKKRFIYEVTTPECKTQKIIVNEFLVGIAISGPGPISAGVIIVWEKNSGKQIATRHTGYISFKTVAVLYDLVIFGEMMTIYIWAPYTDSILKTFCLEDPVVYLYPCPYRFILVYTHNSCWLCDWLQGRKLFRLFPKHIKSGNYRGLVYSDDTMLLMKADTNLIDMLGFC